LGRSIYEGEEDDEDEKAAPVRHLTKGEVLHHGAGWKLILKAGRINK
jgi:hypothetical protein